MKTIETNKIFAEQLVQYSKLCYERNLVGAAGGNLSVRIPGKNIFLVTASGVSLRDINLENIVVVDGEGNTIEALQGLRPSKEIGFHLAIYKIKPEINAVVHVHPVFTTVYTIVRKKVPLCTVSAKLKVKQGAIVPELDPGSKKLQEQISQAVKQAPADTTVLLMEKHGLVAYSSNLCGAFDDAELVEDTAKIAYFGFHLQTSSIGHSIIDLTAPIDETIQSYPTDPPFKKSWHAEYEKDHIYVSKLEMGAHCGTHVDSPIHYLGKGADISNMDLKAFCGQAIVINTPKEPGENITLDDISDVEICCEDIVLFRTGWETRANSPRFFEGQWPGFEPEVVDELIDRKVKAIGGDIASADSPAAIAKGAPAHKKAAAAGLPVFEGLVNLNSVVGKRFLFAGFPLKIDNCEASPIRAVAILYIAT